MSENSRAYVTALFGFDAVVQRVRSHEWGQPSPCAGWDATEVLNHNILVTNLIAEMTRGNPAAVPATGEGREFPTPHGEGYVYASYLFAAPRVAEGGDPIELWNQQRDRVLAALDQPGALDVSARSPWGHDTIDEFLGFAFHEPLVHAWDLARAVGQDVYLDPLLVDRAFALLDDPGDGRELRQPTSLAAPVPTNVSDSTSRLVAAMGRDPLF